MWNFKLALELWFFFRDLNPSSCKCSGLIWLMHIFPSWNFRFCYTTEKLLFIPPPAKASVIQPSHMHTTSSRCWSLAKIILCFSIPQHSRELCQHGIMPACAPLFSHFPAPWEAVPGTSFLTCSPFPHSQWPVLAHHLQWDSSVQMWLSKLSHTLSSPHQEVNVAQATPLLPRLNCDMFGIWWLCGMGGLRSIWISAFNGISGLHHSCWTHCATGTLPFLCSKHCTSSPQPKAPSLSQCLPDLGTSQEGPQAAHLHLLGSGSELAWQTLPGRPILSRMKGGWESEISHSNHRLGAALRIWDNTIILSILKVK